MTRIKMILKHLSLSGMHDIIQSNITWFWGYILLPLLCSMSYNLPILMLSQSFFIKIWPGARKSPGCSLLVSLKADYKKISSWLKQFYYTLENLNVKQQFYQILPKPIIVFLLVLKHSIFFTSYLRKYRLTPASVANVLTGGESIAVIVWINTYWFC